MNDEFLYVPRVSPMMKRDLSAHLLRESDSEVGIFHVLDLPPTRRSLPSEKLTNSKVRSSTEEISALENPAIFTND